uniref:D7 protein n=1 Tax=Anopheles atroparvus TaxID=41427 RepID=A0A182J4P9_ANOAO
MQRVVKLDPKARFWPLLFALLLISSTDADQLATQNGHNGHTLSPDDTLFVHLRCFERFASKQGRDREREVADWLGASQCYLHKSDRTPDFVKCVLTNLGFYDPTEEAFDEFAVRKPNQTVIEFCELRMGEELWNDICRIRSYEISNQTEAMEAHITCIFRGFHYLTGGVIDEIEIVQDFAKAAVLNEASATHIKECVNNSIREESINKRSLQMYACLLHGESNELFKEAFDFREIRSGNLTYLLHNLPYDREQVKHQIMALDKERCDDQQKPTGRILRL